jgi:hypothetical protein
MKCNSGSILMRESRAKKHSEVVCNTRLTRGAWRSISVGIPDRSRELRHNIETCVPSRTTSPLLLLIANLITTRVSTHPALASDAHFAAGRPARKTAGPATVGTNGTRSTRAGCARHAFTNGLQPNASSVAGGRRTQSGIWSNLVVSRFYVGNQEATVCHAKPSSFRPVLVRLCAGSPNFGRTSPLDGLRMLETRGNGSSRT